MCSFGMIWTRKYVCASKLTKGGSEVERLERWNCNPESNPTRIFGTSFEGGPL